MERSGDHVGGDFLGELRDRARSRLRTLVFAEGEEPRIQRAVADAVRDQLFEGVLIGRADEVRVGLENIDASDVAIRVVDPTDGEWSLRTLEWLRKRRAGKNDGEERLEIMSSDALIQAGMMVADGQVAGSVAGCVRTTADVVRAGLTCVGLADGIETISSSFYMVFGSDHQAGRQVLTFTDAGVVPTPTAEQLSDIAVAAVRARRRVVGDDARVAFLSYSTKGSAEGETVATVREALARFRNLMPDVAADGELQGDAALVPAVAARKAPGSEVAGTANVLVFPDLGAANIAYKLVQHLGGAVALGPILQGLACPFNDLSRGASVGDIEAVACITSLSAQ
jgi:phosphate acetyltransferase